MLGLKVGSRKCPCPFAYNVKIFLESRTANTTAIYCFCEIIKIELSSLNVPRANAIHKEAHHR
jgi:hypothetical protein